MERVRKTVRAMPTERRLSLFCRAVLLILMLCVSENSVLATVCAVQDADLPTRSQITQTAAPIASVSAPAATTESGCCILCQGCGSGGCSHAVAPLYTHPTFSLSENIASNLDATGDVRCPNPVSDPLRPPITA
jgi:hypothetical protein